MTLRISKPSFNIREKINEMDGEIPRHKMPAGSIIQVVQGKLTTQTESTAGTGVNVDVGLYVSMSPHYKDSKVLVELDSFPCRIRGSSTTFFISLERKIGYNGTWRTHIVTGEYTYYISGSDEFNDGFNYLDSPGTTERVGYRITTEKTSGGSNIAYNHNAAGGRGAHNYATLTLMEIKQ